MRSLPRGFWLACLGVFFVGVGVRVVTDAALDADAERRERTPGAAALRMLRERGETPRSSATYGGLGAWIDAFDFEPAYQGDGSEPPLGPDVIDDMADAGVRTLYLQAARLDDRASGVLLDRDLLGQFLLRAHGRGMDVVGWYLPLFTDVEADLERLLAVAGFEVLGHRFDGVAVDIEYIEGVPDAGERSARLVELSRQLRDARPTEALGAIVPPPVQLEVVNPQYWRDFPWRAIETSYDVWLPMAYSTTRAGTGYRDAYRYAEESVRRLRNNLGRPDVLVHIVGGIGDQMTSEDLRGLRRAIEDTGAIGGSVYDWNSLPPERQAELSTLVPG